MSIKTFFDVNTNSNLQFGLSQLKEAVETYGKEDVLEYIQEKETDLCLFPIFTSLEDECDEQGAGQGLFDVGTTDITEEGVTLYGNTALQGQGMNYEILVRWDGSHEVLFSETNVDGKFGLVALNDNATFRFYQFT